jgi:PadR family transcriptional regulator PadR
MGQTNPNFMNGVPELLILSLLKRREMYGYELVQQIRLATGSVVMVGEGVVYPALHGLEKDGALRSHRKTVEGRSRVYYILTPAGEARLTELSGAWAKLQQAIKDALGGVTHAPAL